MSPSHMEYRLYLQNYFHFDDIFGGLNLYINLKLRLQISVHVLYYVFLLTRSSGVEDGVKVWYVEVGSVVHFGPHLLLNDYKNTKEGLR